MSDSGRSSLGKNRLKNKERMIEEKSKISPDSLPADGLESSSGPPSSVVSPSLQVPKAHRNKVPRTVKEKRTFHQPSVDEVPKTVKEKRTFHQPSMDEVPKTVKEKRTFHQPSVDEVPKTVGEKKKGRKSCDKKRRSKRSSGDRQKKVSDLDTLFKGISESNDKVLEKVDSDKSETETPSWEESSDFAVVDEIYSAAGRIEKNLLLSSAYNARLLGEISTGLDETERHVQYIRSKVQSNTRDLDAMRVQIDTITKLSEKRHIDILSCLIVLSGVFFMKNKQNPDDKSGEILADSKNISAAERVTPLFDAVTDIDDAEKILSDLLLKIGPDKINSLLQSRSFEGKERTEMP